MEKRSDDAAQWAARGGRRRLVLVAPSGAQHELRLGHIEAFESKAKHNLVPIGQQSFGQKINAQQKYTAPKGKEMEIETKARNAVVVRLFSRATHRYIYANVCVCVLVCRVVGLTIEVGAATPVDVSHKLRMFPETAHCAQMTILMQKKWIVNGTVLKTEER